MPDLTGLSDPIRAVYASCVDECMAAIARHFNVKASGNTGTFDWQTQKLAELGSLRREAAEIIARQLYGVDAMVAEAVEAAMLRSLREVEPELQAAARAGLLQDAEPGMSPAMRLALDAYSRQAREQLNLVNTVMLDSCLMNYRRIAANTAAYEQQLARAQEILNAETGKVVSGVSSRQEAVRRAVRQFADTGLTGFTDRAGHVWSPEAYAAMDVRTTVMNAAREAVLIRNEEYGNDLVSVPVNATARPKCYPWQGKVISTADRPRIAHDLHGQPIQVHARSATSYGDPDGLWGINCHHMPSPFFDGLSVLRGDVPPKADNDERYRLQQTQRRYEREVRARKREAVMLEAAGDEEGFREAALKVKTAQRRLREHCEAGNLTMRHDRTQALGYSRSISRKATAAADLQRKVGQIRELIRSPATSKQLNLGNQNKHIPGANGYIEGRSYLYGTLADAQALVDRWHGTGEIRFTSRGEWVQKEFVTAAENIGVCIDPATGQGMPTNRFAIHYGKKGTHIVPARREK